MESSEHRELRRQLGSEAQEMCQKVLEMLHLARDAFRRQDSQRLERTADLGREIHEREKELTQRIPGRFAGLSGSIVEAEFSFLPMHLERIGDNVEFLVRAIHRTIADGVPFSERAITEIDTLFEKIIELVECVRDAIGTENKVLMRHVIEEGRNCERLLSEFALFHQERLIQGLCSPKSSSVYLAILDYLKGIEEHVRQMAQVLLASKKS
jgi:Na+/phosphate symporter